MIPLTMREHSEKSQSSSQHKLYASIKTEILRLTTQRRRWIALRCAELLCTIGRATATIGAYTNRQGERLWKRTVSSRVVQPLVSPSAVTRWYKDYLDGFDPSSLHLSRSPRVTIILPIVVGRPDWLKTTLESVIAQIYTAWELICICDPDTDQRSADLLTSYAKKDPRVRLLANPKSFSLTAATNEAISEASGEYIFFLEETDFLEPPALARLCEAAVQDRGDLIYSDEALTSEDIEEITQIQARPQFLYFYYLAHPYFERPVMVRTALARDVGGLREDLPVQKNIDFILRCLEVTRHVTHVPDVLYRARMTAQRRLQRDALTHTASDLRQEHLRRLGYPDAIVRSGRSPNTFSYRFFGTLRRRVLGIIPTRNGVDLLRRCIETVRATTMNVDLDLVVVDHDSDDPATLSYLASVEREGTARVIPYSGVFNYSAINNFAVRRAGAGYDLYLFINNDIEAQSTGWLEAMMDLAMHKDIGAVGSILLYPDGRVQHSGVIVGHFGPAEHAYRHAPYGKDTPGYLSGLHATREFAAVTGACMMVPASVFDAVGGFDEHLQVGFNDIDLCLRIGAKGFRIVSCADAVLTHHESATRGQSRDDPHPDDTCLFMRRYAQLTRDGDAFYTPLLSKTNLRYELDGAKPARWNARPRTWN